MPLETTDLLVHFCDITGQIRLRQFTDLLFIGIVKSLNRVLAVDLVRVNQQVVELERPFVYCLRGVICADPYGELISMDAKDGHAYLDALASCDHLDHEHASLNHPLEQGDSVDRYLADREI